MNHLGNTTAERIQNGGIRSFQKWMAESPHTIRHLSVERGIYFDAIILTSKDKEYEKIMFLNVANEIPLMVGDMMNWTLEDGTIEKWILLQEEKKVNGTYRTFWIVRCNYLVKWIDKDGHEQSSWCYVVSSLDSKIKGNFRTWHNLITPQPNKYAEILMPRRDIERSTNFIIEEESWQLVEYDHTSVPGVVYLSLTEGKINAIYDDLIENVADTDKRAKYEISAPIIHQKFNVGDEITNVSFTITKNGIPTTADNLPYKLLPGDEHTKIDKHTNRLYAYSAAEDVKIIVQLVDYPQVPVQEIYIDIGEGEQEFSAYIEGPDKLRLDNKALYVLKAIPELDSEAIVNFTILGDGLAAIIENTNTSCTIRANKKNKLGDITLVATYNNIEYLKTIQIIPVW